MLTPRCCSDPGLSQAPLLSQATGRGQAAPHGTQCCATDPVSCTAPPIPGTSHWPPAPWHTKRRRGWHSPRTAWSTRKEHRSEGNANHPTASQLSKKAAFGPTPGLPAPCGWGLFPSPLTTATGSQQDCSSWSLNNQVPPECREEWGLGLLRREWVGQQCLSISRTQARQGSQLVRAREANLTLRKPRGLQRPRDPPTGTAASPPPASPGLRPGTYP